MARYEDAILSSTHGKIVVGVVKVNTLLQYLIFFLASLWGGCDKFMLAKASRKMVIV